MKNQKVIMLEFNELTPSLMKKFIEEGHLPNFDKLHSQGVIYTTDANTSGEELNPWVQWITVHTGLTPEEHGVFLLKDLDNFNGDFIWDLVSEKGADSWVCGSMNTKHKEGFKGNFLPDPWATNASPFPKNKFDTYFDFISQSVHGHSSSKHIPAINFVKYMFKNGLSINTMFKIGKQVISEIFNKNISWKRALVLDWIQFDIFKNTYVKEQPKLSTFFSNSTAHYQHHYWRDMSPTEFGSTANNTDKTKKDAILTAYKNMDSLLGKFLSLIDDNTVIAFVTALSQKPYLKSERHYFHIHDIDVFLEKFKIQTKVKYKPIMAEQFHLECQTEEEAKELAKYLETFHMESSDYFHVGSNQTLLVSQEGINVHVQCRCSKITSENAKIINKENNFDIPFGDVFYHMEGVKCGMHDPHGMFWLYNTGEAHNVVSSPIPLEDTHQHIMSIINS